MFSLGVTGRLLDERWPTDSRFDPSRFLADGGSKPGSQLPFGIGAHTCIGQRIALLEIKIFVALLLRGYEYEIKSSKRPFIGRESDGMPTTFSRRA